MGSRAKRVIPNTNQINDEAIKLGGEDQKLSNTKHSELNNME